MVALFALFVEVAVSAPLIIVARRVATLMSLAVVVLMWAFA